MLAYTVDGTALANPSRWITDAGSAFAAPVFRGDDLLVPGAAGEIPLTPVRAVAYDEFEVRISGLVNADGTTAADESATFLTNLRALQALLIPSDGSTITVTKTVTTASGDVVLGPTECRCVSDLTPRMEAPWTGSVLVRLKVYSGWA